jgi:hypothetical protein
LVSRFRADVDPALLAHRMLLPEPDDCTEQLTNALTDEVNAIVAADELVAKSVSVEQCLERAETLMIAEPDAKKLADRFDKSSDVRRDILRLVRDGIPSGNRSHSKWATKLFSEPSKAPQSDLDLAAILQSRRHHAKTPPILTLGVVIERMTGGKAGLPQGFYLCLQPYCDSVRVDGACGFPFLTLGVAPTVAPAFVIADGVQARPLSAEAKLLNVRQAVFTGPTPPGPVYASKHNGSWVFRTSARSQTAYRYVGRLRDAHAMNIAHELGSDASRIGVDDPEWLRLGRPVGAVGAAPDSITPLG